MTANDSACQVCGQARLREVDGFAALPRITSDCRAHPAGGSLYVCLACGGVQKLPDAQWLREIGGIYAGYEAYYQSGGEEQIVFDRASGTPRRRSDVILSGLVNSALLPASGRALDVGCGNGATLTALSAALADWSFSGYELGDGALPRLTRISRFQRLHTGSLDAIGQSFDLVTMIHSLEHFPSPAITLAQLVPIVGTGKLFIEVCNVEENPFDILVADHLMHFSPVTLARILRCAGFTPVSIATDWVAKEISVIAKAAAAPLADDTSAAVDAMATYAKMTGYVDWLLNLRDKAMSAADGAYSFGLFGTSIAATWLAPQLADKVAFFVDEDSNRIGREHLGRPVIPPSAIPEDSRVFLALAPKVASAIANRLSSLPCTLIMPPSLVD
jgi:SAM-dependent methyltransferase